MDKYNQVYMKNKVGNWVQSVDIFSKIAKREPKAEFLVFNRFLKHECDYIQRVLDHPDDTFDPIDNALAIYYKTDIFGVKRVQEDLLKTTSLQVGMAGPSILQLGQEAPINHANSRASTAHTVAAILGGG